MKWGPCEPGREDLGGGGGSRSGLFTEHKEALLPGLWPGTQGKSVAHRTWRILRAGPGPRPAPWALLSSSGREGAAETRHRSAPGPGGPAPGARPGFRGPGPRHGAAQRKVSSLFLRVSRSIAMIGTSRRQIRR